MFQRALNTGGFPETIWDVSKTPPLDSSHVDPIWDGSPTFSVRYSAAQSQSSSRPHSGKTGNTSRNSAPTGSTTVNRGRNDVDLGILRETGSRMREHRRKESAYANFSMNVFATTHSEQHPIVADDELAKRATIAVTPSHDMTRTHSTFRANTSNRRSDTAFAQYRQFCKANFTK